MSVIYYTLCCVALLYYAMFGFLVDFQCPIAVALLPHTHTVWHKRQFYFYFFFSLSLSLSISSLWPILYARLSWRQIIWRGEREWFFRLWSQSRLCNTCYPITATMFICFTHPLAHFGKYPLHFIRITIKRWVAHEYERKNDRKSENKSKMTEKKFK